MTLVTVAAVFSKFLPVQTELYSTVLAGLFGHKEISGILIRKCPPLAKVVIYMPNVVSERYKVKQRTILNILRVIQVYETHYKYVVSIFAFEKITLRNV